MKFPKLFDSGAVALGAEPGTQKEACKDEPGLFMFDRFLSGTDVLEKGRPEPRE